MKLPANKEADDTAWFRLATAGWTRVMCHGRVADDSAKVPQGQNLVIIVPGNPGVEKFYRRFSRLLLAELQIDDEDWAVWTVSHLNHVQPPVELCDGQEAALIGLRGQIDQKLEFVRRFVSADRPPKLYLVGHSIGCYMTLKLLASLLADGYAVEKVFLLFPTIERMIDSPNGRSHSPLFFTSLYRLVRSAAVVADWLPNKWKRLLANWWLWDEDDCVKEALIELTNKNSLRNVVSMTREELSVVTELDSDLVTGYADLLTFYYGTMDRWCPLSYGEDMRRLFTSHMDSKTAEEKVIFCDSDCKHAFVLGHSDVMAVKVAALVRRRRNSSNTKRKIK